MTPQDDLNLALQHHQTGRLDQAARLYQAILAREPRQADALHLLGVVALQQGNPARAAELIGQAVAIKPSVAVFHANLAEAYRALGQPDRAVGCCRTALRLQPHYPEAANNLGLALLARCEAEEAVAQFRAAVRLRPDFALAHNNLGNALRQQGDKAQALTHFRQAVRLDPNLAEAHSNLGQLLLELHQPQEALPHCRAAVRLRPHFPEAHNNLGNVLREQGQLDEARACYAEALRLNPHLGMTHNNMAQALHEEGRLEEAIAWYQQALEMEPNSARFHSNLASALAEQDNYEEAISRYEIALRIAPDSAGAHHGLGLVLQEKGRPEEALARHREALRHDPDFAPAHCSLGSVLEEFGEFAEAQDCFRAALRSDPTHAGAAAQLATLLRGQLPEADQAAMQELLANAQLIDGKRSSLHFGLAQVLDARGAYVEAADHLQRANALCLASLQRHGKNYYPADHTRFVDGLIAAFAPEFFEFTRGFGLDTERPVFIVGMPRSGTTLLEQILASHSQVFGAGELRLAREAFESLPRALTVEAAPVECVARLDRAITRRLAQRHLDRLAELNRPAQRVTDKMPDNYLYLGLLATLFPRAKYIHCRRDPRDVAVSCWMTNFRSIRWASDPEHIASRFREYQRIMEHWRRVLPVPLLEVDYEETVADLEGVARRMIAWSGLDWEPACLDFHATARPVRTASVAQVRQPLYGKSVQRWKKYETALAPLLASLAPPEQPAESKRS
jgi:tetratricopeptide (TPR) repeat protein